MPNATAMSMAGDVLGGLLEGTEQQGLVSTAERLREVRTLVGSDLREVEAAIAALPLQTDDVRASAAHLLAQGGKRLRPLCVALASRIGSGFSPAARDVAVAVELVHCATLLHDDVVDHGDTRRGAPTSRALYGNAASIFAGDYLLVVALRLVRASAGLDVLDRLLDRIDAMIRAEAVQLALRGRFLADEASYFEIVEGKTAALFDWALYAGARAGGLGVAQAESLARYGQSLGVAFQLVDDALDYAGDAATLGKEPLADLREGKATYPLLHAMAHDPSLRGRVEAVAAGTVNAADPAVAEAVAAAIRSTDAVAVTRALAADHVARAVDALATLPDGPARRALVHVAHATVHREV